MFIHFGEPITVNDIDLKASDGIRNQTFNSKLQTQLQQLIYEIPSSDKAMQEKKLAKRPGLLEKIILFFPALIGFLVNAPLYIPVRNLVKKKAGGTGHYDSVMLGVLLITYPLYLLLGVLITYLISSSNWSWLVLLAFPFAAWAYVRLKEQLD